MEDSVTSFFEVRFIHLKTCKLIVAAERKDNAMMLRLEQAWESRMKESKLFLKQEGNEVQNGT